jgi:uncharacterized protein (TIGR02246 family)
MVATTPEQAVDLADRCFNGGDIEGVLSFYEENAVIVTEPGKTARGTAEMRAFFEQVMQTGASARQLKTHVIEADGVALFLSRWTLTTKTAGQQDSARRFTAVTVFRKQPDGAWKALIDNSLGPLVLGPE